MSEQPSDWWAIAGIAALVIADVVLVALALASTRAPVPPAAAGVAPTALPSSGADATPTPTPEPRPAVPSVAGLSVTLGAVDDTVAYRAATGSCPDAAAGIEVTVDAGATWSPATPIDARSIQSISATSEEVSVIAADPASCAPSMHRSFVQGADWVVADDLGSRWFLDGGSVVAPGGSAAAPCENPVQVAARSDTEAAVLCEDATLTATSDAGASWAGPAAVANAASVTSGADGYFVAVTDHDGCEGAQVISVSTELQPSAPGACVPSNAGPGTTVLSAAANGLLWLWSGDVIARSSDGGATW